MMRVASSDHNKADLSNWWQSAASGLRHFQNILQVLSKSYELLTNETNIWLDKISKTVINWESKYFS
jgi:hypothetical protein